MSGKPSITRVVKYIRKGDKGDAAETYQLVASHTAVSRTFDDTNSGSWSMSPGTVNVKCVKVSGSDSTVLSALPAGYYIKYSRDGGTQAEIAYSSISGSLVTGTLFGSGTYHLVTFYLYNGSNQCVAVESICLNDNGKNSLSYNIVASISQFKTNAGRTITQTCTCKAYRTIAGNTPAQMGTNDGCALTVAGYDDNNVSHYGYGGSNQIAFSTNSTSDGKYSTRFEVTLKVNNVEVAKLSIPVVMDGAKGEQGPALRGPQAWSDCATGYKFQAGGEGDDFKDVVLFDGDYYSCIKSHQKPASGGYTTNGAGKKILDSTYWTLGDKVELVATKILLATYALVKNLGVEAIDMKDANGNVLFQAKDGVVTCKTGNFDNVNIQSGNIAGFKISGNGLTNDPFKNDAYVIFRNDAHNCFAGIGGNVLPASSGQRAVARFENEDNNDWWGLGHNIAMLLSAKNSDYNHAFIGTGNGTLNGWIGGYLFSKFSCTKANTIYDGYVTLKTNNRWLVYSSVSSSGVALPKLTEVRNALFIGTGVAFCVELTICADLSTTNFDIYGRNKKQDSSKAYPWNTTELPVMTHWDGGRYDSLAMGAGDSVTFLLIYDPSKTGTLDDFSLYYTARIINRQD